MVPMAPLVSSEPRRMRIDIEQAQALVRKLDSEKGFKENLLCRADNEMVNRDKSYGGSTGPVIIIRGLTSVKSLDGFELLDTLITYLWRVHGVDYYGMLESSEAKGLRHVRVDGETLNATNDGAEEEKKLDLRWQERLKGQDPLEVMTAKGKIDAAAVEALDPYILKIRDENYGWKYGYGATDCMKLFHAADFVHKHLKSKHPELVMELTSKVREDLYFQNYMNDESAPDGTPIMQPSVLKEKPLRHRPGLNNRLKDERGSRRERTIPPVAPFLSDMPPPPVLMPVPGASPLGPFVPAPPEVAMRMVRKQGGPSPFEGRRNRRSGPQLGGPAPIIARTPAFGLDPRRLRSYQDRDAPKDVVTVIDYRSL